MEPSSRITLDFPIGEHDRQRGWRRVLDDALKEVEAQYVDGFRSHPHAVIHIMVRIDDQPDYKLPRHMVD